GVHFDPLRLSDLADTQSRGGPFVLAVLATLFLEFQGPQEWALFTGRGQRQPEGLEGDPGIRALAYARKGPGHDVKAAVRAALDLQESDVFPMGGVGTEEPTVLRLGDPQGGQVAVVGHSLGVVLSQADTVQVNAGD